jgi:hypothetical protein
VGYAHAQILLRVELVSVGIEAVCDVVEIILDMDGFDSMSAKFGVIRQSEVDENAIVFRFRQPLAALNPFAHLNLQSGDIPARHSGNDLLGCRVMHTTFGAVVDVRAGLAGDSWGAFHGGYTYGSEDNKKADSKAGLYHRT